MRNGGVKSPPIFGNTKMGGSMAGPNCHFSVLNELKKTASSESRILAFK